MLQSVEAEVDVDGTVRLLTPVKVTRTTRAVLTLLDDASHENIIPPAITDLAEREWTIHEIVRSMQSNLISPDAPRFTREELHERR